MCRWCPQQGPGHVKLGGFGGNLLLNQLRQAARVVSRCRWRWRAGVRQTKARPFLFFYSFLFLCRRRWR